MAGRLIDSLKLTSVLIELEAVGIADTASLSSNANRTLELGQQCDLPGLLSTSQQTYRQLQRLRILLDEKWNQASVAGDLGRLNQIALAVANTREAQQEWEEQVLSTVVDNCECKKEG